MLCVGAIDVPRRKKGKKVTNQRVILVPLLIKSGLNSMENQGGER